MEHLDRLIPLAVLGAVGVFLLILVRRARRDNPVARPIEPAPDSVSQDVHVPVAIPAAPIALKVETPAIVKAPVIPTAPIVKAVSTPVVAPRKRAKRTRRVPKTPIEAVLGMLKTRDALMSAQLLREIFDAPVSKRR